MCVMDLMYSKCHWLIFFLGVESGCNYYKYLNSVWTEPDWALKREVTMVLSCSVNMVIAKERRTDRRRGDRQSKGLRERDTFSPYLKLIQIACKYLVVNVWVCVRESMSVSKELRLFSRLCHVATGNSLNDYCYNGERERARVWMCASLI